MKNSFVSICLLLSACGGVAHGQVGRLVAELVPSDTDAYQGFGHSVSIAGDFVVVGAPIGDAGGDPGHALGFVLGSGLVQNESFIYSGLVDDTMFGLHVATDGQTVLVGTGEADEAAAPYSSVSFFDRSTGAFEGRVDDSTGLRNQGFGTALAVKNGSVVIGAPGSKDLAGFTAGVGYFSNTTTRSLVSFGPPAGYTPDYSWFAYSVDLMGTYVAIGTADFDNKSPRTEAFLYSDSGTLLETLVPSDHADYDGFGKDVALAEVGSTTYVAVGAPYNSGASLTDRGAVYLFDASDGSQEYQLVASDATSYDRFGASVAASGSYLVVGAPDRSQSNNQSGVYVYDISVNPPQEVVKISAASVGASRKFGLDVSISGPLVVVGGNGDLYVDDPDSAGEVYVFDLRCSGADLAEPYGTLNHLDTSAYLAAYAAGDPSADLAGNTDGSPDGLFNHFDVSAYLALYGEGCP